MHTGTFQRTWKTIQVLIIEVLTVVLNQFRRTVLLSSSVLYSVFLFFFFPFSFTPCFLLFYPGENKSDFFP